jgi:hypothetical protein
MKLLLSRIILFSIPLVFLIHLKPAYLLIDNKYQKIVAGNEVYLSIEKSKQKTHRKKILLGDSAGYQLFPNLDNNSNIISLACNQAVGMVGQYILLENYLKAGNEIDTVYFVFGPDGFINNLDQVYTYHYFLKPFFKEENKGYFTEHVLQQIRKIPYFFLCREPLILTSNWAPKFKCRDSANNIFLSPISIEYLKKIKILKEEHNFNIIFYSAPTSIKKKYEIDKFYYNEIICNDLEDEFEAFFKNLIYLDDSCFLDGVHLKNPKEYSDLYKKEWIK